MKVTKKIEKGELIIDVELTEKEREFLIGIRLSTGYLTCSDGRTHLAYLKEAVYAGKKLDFTRMVSCDNGHLFNNLIDQTPDYIAKSVMDIYNSLVAEKARLDALSGSVEILSKQEVVTQLIEQNNVYYRNSKGQITKLD